MLFLRALADVDVPRAQLEQARLELPAPIPEEDRRRPMMPERTVVRASTAADVDRLLTARILCP